MLAEFGRLSLAEVLAPAIELARGYPIDAETADAIERDRALLAQWPDSKRVLLPHLDASDPTKRAAPEPGEIFRQPELAATLEKLVAAERDALAAGKPRREAILAAYERFYRGDASRGTPGVGLGLSLVDAVAKLHGGSLQFADNHPGLRVLLTVAPQGA